MPKEDSATLTKSSDLLLELKVDRYGSITVNDTFPFDTGDQIWGSIASADLDNDNNLDFVVTSKSGFIYIFDQNGLKAEYDAGRWLIGTPVIGNLDSDEDLEKLLSAVKEILN